METIIDNKYKEYVNNKRVVFVGPAPILVGKGLNKFVDSFDVVVRTNGSILLLDNPKYRKDYGSRIDVLYSNVQFHRELGSPFPIESWKEKYNIKFICMKTCGGVFLDTYRKVMPVRTLNKLIGELHKKVEGLLMGPIILTDLIRQQPKELYVTGMDFFIHKPDDFIPGDYREYFPGYLPKKIVVKADIANIGRVDPHDQYSNAVYMNDLYKQNLLILDPAVEEAMKVVLDNPAYYNYTAKLERVKKKEKK